jgi:hypothetical protein
MLHGAKVAKIFQIIKLVPLLALFAKKNGGLLVETSILCNFVTKLVIVSKS